MDDEADVLTALRELLCYDGYDILTASSAAEAFELLALHQVQVILCDPYALTMSGTGFLDRVREPHSRYASDCFIRILDSIIKAINRGTIILYTKPWDEEVLCDDIREAFARFNAASAAG